MCADWYRFCKINHHHNNHESLRNEMKFSTSSFISFRGLELLTSRCRELGGWSTNQADQAKDYSGEQGLPSEG